MVDKVVEKDGKYYSKEKNKEINWSSVKKDFNKWLSADTDKTRGDVFIDTWIHMGLGLVTAGLYFLVYAGYYLYRFVEDSKKAGKTGCWTKTVTSYNPVEVEEAESVAEEEMSDEGSGWKNLADEQKEDVREGREEGTDGKDKDLLG